MPTGESKESRIKSPLLYLNLRSVTPSEILSVENEAEISSGGKIVSFVACEEVPFDRWDWFKWQEYKLILSHDPNHVRLDRVSSGSCMFLEDHSSHADKRIGKVLSASIANKKLTVEARLNSLEAGQRFYQEVLDKTEPPKSVGAAVYETEVVETALYEEDEDGYKKMIRPATLRAIDWELMEVSSVSVPAIAGAATKEASNEQQYMMLMHGDPGLDIPEETIKKLSPQTEEKKRKTERGAKLPNKPKSPKKKAMSLQETLSELEHDDLLDRAVELNNAHLAKDTEIASLKQQLAEQESLKAELAAKDAEIAKITRQKQISDRYRELRSRADRLNTATKLSAAEYDSIFAENISDDLQRLQESDTAETELASIEFYLSQTEKRSPLLNTEILSGKEELPKPAGTQLSEYLAEVQQSYENAWRS